jgi:hypothetical protein
MVVLLELRQLVLHVTAESIRQLAMTSRDHNFHVNLPLNSWFRVDQRPSMPSCGQADAPDPWRDPVLGRDGARPADLVFDPTIAC